MYNDYNAAVSNKLSTRLYSSKLCTNILRAEEIVCIVCSVIEQAIFIYHFFINKYQLVQICILTFTFINRYITVICLD